MRPAVAGLRFVGADAAGLRYAVGELWNYHVASMKTAMLEAPLSLEDAPRSRSASLWNWDFLTNWDDDLGRIHQTAQCDPAESFQPYSSSRRI